MRLYYHPRSTCSRRVLMTAAHLGVSLERVIVDLATGAQHAPDFLKLNPNHRVPVLDDQGFILWESYAIMQYLAESSGDQSIYPATAQGRADVSRWLHWCGQYFMPGVTILNWENSIKQLLALGPADPAEVGKGEALLQEAAAILDAHLAGRDWICGSGVTLADFAIAAPMADQDRAKFPLRDFAHLQRWFEQVRMLDAWRNSEV